MSIKRKFAELDEKDYDAEELLILKMMDESVDSDSDSDSSDSEYRESESEPLYEKLCKPCQTVKPLSAFGKDRTHSDGMKSSCKSCINQNQKRRHVTCPPGGYLVSLIGHARQHAKDVVHGRNRSVDNSDNSDNSDNLDHLDNSDNSDDDSDSSGSDSSDSEAEPLGEKLCKPCQTLKPVSDFGKDKTHSDGLKSSCKSCINKNQKRRRVNVNDLDSSGSDSSASDDKKRNIEAKRNMGQKRKRKTCQHQDELGSSDCLSRAQKSKTGTGAVGMCIAHGGGDRCQLPCCGFEGQIPTWSMGTHPQTGQNMCRHSIRCYIESYIRNSKMYTALLKHFKLKQGLTMRGEHAFYHALCLKVPDLRLSEVVLDESVAKLLGKRKSVHDYKPDYFHAFVVGTQSDNISLGLHGEYDEDRDHEDNEERLDAIAEASSCGRDNVYVFRVLGDHGGSQAVCKRVTRKEHTYYSLTPHGERVVEETAVVVRERIAWIRQGLAPNADRPRKVYVNFAGL